MATSRGVLGPAAARWNDYLGTAAADDADAMLKRPSLYELAGLDRDRWMILSMDVEHVAADTTVTLYAIDKVAHGIVKSADLDRLADAEGSLPVTAYTLPGQSAEQFLNDAFRSISIRLVSRDAQQHSLVVAPLHDTV